MNIGISTSCLYPLETEKSFEKLGEMGIKNTEIFFNAPSEITKDSIKNFNSIKDYYGMKVFSVHPFTSFAEPLFFFSSYERRFGEMLEFYKRYIDAANGLGAEFIAVHGSKLPGDISWETYFERFSILYEEGKKQGIIFAQENVFNHFSQSPDFLRKMKKYMGDDFKMVFDIKQMRKAEYSLSDFLPEFSENIVNIHISDHNENHFCMPPGKGSFDFGNLFGEMKKVDYKGAYIIELYRKNFENTEELKTSFDFLKRF